MDEATKFIENVFEFTNEEKLIDQKANFKSLTSWNSLNALIIHTNILENYQVDLSVEDFENCDTIQDLWICVKHKMRT